MRTSFAVQDMTIHRIVEQEYGFTPLFDFLPTLGKEQFEEPPRTAADSARVKARADSVAKARSDSAKADSAKVVPDRGSPGTAKADSSAKKPLFR